MTCSGLFQFSGFTAALRKAWLSTCRVQALDQTRSCHHLLVSRSPPCTSFSLSVKESNSSACLINSMSELIHITHVTVPGTQHMPDKRQLFLCLVFSHEHPHLGKRKCYRKRIIQMKTRFLTVLRTLQRNQMGFQF